MLRTSFVTAQPPANEKLMGTAKTAEVNVASDEGAAAEGEVVAPRGVAVAEGEVVAVVPPQAATAIKVADTSPMRRLFARTSQRWRDIRQLR